MPALEYLNPYFSTKQLLVSGKQNFSEFPNFGCDAVALTSVSVEMLSGSFMRGIVRLAAGRFDKIMPRDGLLERGQRGEKGLVRSHARSHLCQHLLPNDRQIYP